MTLKGKAAIVTGSTSGIGLAIAHALAAEGANIVLNGFGDAALIAQVVQQIEAKGVKAIHSPADMTKPEEIRAMIALCEKTFGAVDVLVNNAGIQSTGLIETYPEETWDKIIAINLSAVFHATKAALPGMQKRNYGRIINIASVHGLVGSPQKGAYVAAKHGVVGFTKVTALETAEHNITCNAICPGWVHTPLVDKQVDDRMKVEGLPREETISKMIGEKQPNKRFTKPEQIGGLAVFLCSEAASTTTGSAITIDGGWTCH